MKTWQTAAAAATVLSFSTLAHAGPYSAAMADPGNPWDAPVPGFIGPHGAGKARLDDGEGNFVNPGNRVNPLFFAWAEECVDYQRADTDTPYSDPALALGPVTGDNFHVVSLGDLTDARIAEGASPGEITLRFAKPIKDLSGADFVIFENGFISGFNTGGSGAGGIFAELARVEVSADGVVFHRFNSVSSTPAAVGGYGTIHPTDVYNLAGKHVNAYGNSWGTPFDIAQTGLGEITHIRIIDVPGDGSFKDSGGNPIYDSWHTFGSGGFDLDAVGAISTRMTYSGWPLLEKLEAGSRGEGDDPDGDGISNLLEYAFGLDPSTADSWGTGWKQQPVANGGADGFAISCLRDERPLDLLREVQVSGDMVSWTTLASSTGGSPFLRGENHEPVISHVSAGGIASVAVIRQDSIRDTRPIAAGQPRFYRLKVTRIDP